jgi:hypothetical protein
MRRVHACAAFGKRLGDEPPGAVVAVRAADSNKQRASALVHVICRDPE